MALPLVTSLPWLNNNQDPVATYQRSQALVQQMQNQKAQQEQQQAELAQRAQESAMHAQFQQRALALKEQEAKSAVQIEADRLRQKGQALEFEQKQEQMKNELLAQAPSLVNLPGLPPGALHGGRYYPGPRQVDTSQLGKSIPVYQDNDPTKPLIGHVARTSEAGGAFTRAVRPGETSEEKAVAGEAREARSTDRRVLMDDRAALNKIKNAVSWGDRTPEEKAGVLQKLAETEEKLGAYRTTKPEAAPATSTGVRIRRKSDGKILRYKGNKADVPTAEYDFVE